MYTFYAKYRFEHYTFKADNMDQARAYVLRVFGAKPYRIGLVN